MARSPTPVLPRLRWRLTALLAVGLVGLLGLLAASPELHAQADCADCDPPPAEHVCAVTLFAQGAENPAETAPLLPAPRRLVVAGLQVADTAPPRAVDVRLPSGRDPPAR